MEFKPHYNFTIDVNDRVMITHMHGVWNLEGVQVYFDAIKEAARPLISDKWVRVADLSDFEGGSMELMDALIDIQNWSVQNNCIQLYLVCPRLMNKMIVEQNEPKYNQMDMFDSLELAVEQAKRLLRSTSAN